MSGQLLLGIDAGGTHTRALLCDASGAVLGSGRAGPSNVHAASQSFAVSEVRAAVSDAIATAGFEPPITLAGCVLASAGLEQEDGTDDVFELLAGLVSGGKGRIVSDVLAAWAGALGMQPGVLVVSGTGSICLGVDAEGRRTRVGGWGPRFGDEGSAYRIATDAIGTALRTLDGREHEPEILDAFLDFAGIQPGNGRPPFAPAVDWLYSADRTNAQIARFAPVVTQLATGGNGAAHGILDNAAQALEGMVIAALPRTSPPTAVTVSYAGGVLLGSETVRDLLRRNLEAAESVRGAVGRHEDSGQPRLRVVEPRLSPVAGAVLLAGEQGGLVPGEAMLDALSAHRSSR